MTTKKDLLDGIRYHMMKFTQSKAGGKPIDPTDQDDFARPVTLHRRDARQPPPGRAVKTEAPEVPQGDEEEVERQAQRKAEREAQRAIDQAKIAPVAKDPNPKRPKKQKEEKTTFNRAPKTETAKKASDLRYEEALPWHLEDAEGKNVWVGNFVDTLSGSNVAFMIDESVFRMIPLEKWYKFTSKPPFQTYDIDEVEAFMSKKVDVGRWVMRDEEKKAGRKDLEATRKMFYGSGPMVKTESATFKAASRSEKLEHDEIDMSGDEFQDDDEAPMFERNDDEDTKDSKDRIRREQLGANLFGEGDEQEVDKELDEQLREEILRQKLGKATKKALIKRDREDIYESDDSEENPWSSSVKSFLSTWVKIMLTDISSLMTTPPTRKKRKTRKMTRRRTSTRTTRTRVVPDPRVPTLPPGRSPKALRRASRSSEPARQHSPSPVETNLPAKSLRRMSHLPREVGLALLLYRAEPLVDPRLLDLVVMERQLLARCQMELHPRGRS